MAKQYQALFLLLSVSYLCSSRLTAATITTAPTTKEALKFIQSSCKTTTYQSLCFQSLSVYANTIKTNPRYLVEAAIGVSLNQARYVKFLASKLMRNGQFRILQDCAQSTDAFNTDCSCTVQELERCNTWEDCLFHISNAETCTISAESYLVDNTCSSPFSNVKISVQGRISDAVKKSLLTRLVKLEHEINNDKLLFKAFAKN